MVDFLGSLERIFGLSSVCTNLANMQGHKLCHYPEHIMMEQWDIQ